jgi:hypothetical protein
MNICQPIGNALKLVEIDDKTVLSISKLESRDKVIWMENELAAVIINKYLELKS